MDLPLDELCFAIGTAFHAHYTYQATQDAPEPSQPTQPTLRSSLRLRQCTCLSAWATLTAWSCLTPQNVLHGLLSRHEDYTPRHQLMIFITRFQYSRDWRLQVSIVPHTISPSMEPHRRFSLLCSQHKPHPVPLEKPQNPTHILQASPSHKALPAAGLTAWGIPAWVQRAGMAQFSGSIVDWGCRHARPSSRGGVHTLAWCRRGLDEALRGDLRARQQSFTIHHHPKMVYSNNRGRCSWPGRLPQTEWHSRHMKTACGSGTTVMLIPRDAWIGSRDVAVQLGFHLLGPQQSLTTTSVDVQLTIRPKCSESTAFSRHYSNGLPTEALVPWRDVVQLRPVPSRLRSDSASHSVPNVHCRRLGAEGARRSRLVCIASSMIGRDGLCGQRRVFFERQRSVSSTPLYRLRRGCGKSLHSPSHMSSLDVRREHLTNVPPVLTLA